MEVEICSKCEKKLAVIGDLCQFCHEEFNELTLEVLKQMPPHEVFAKGTVENSPKGVYMTDNRLGDKLLWIAKRGEIHDWAIYLHWEESGYEHVLRNGDKLTNSDYIRKLVPCNDEALEMYRR